MIRIGIVSDTHGFWDAKLTEFFSNCAEIWHAGDIGNIETADLINSIKPLRAVFGNIDDHKVRSAYPEIQRFKIENVEVVIKHIVGYPGRYENPIKKLVETDPPKLLIAGHSHVLKVMHDKKHDLLFINPGAAGISGFHKFRTAIRFEIDGSNFKNLEVLEIKR